MTIDRYVVTLRASLLVHPARAAELAEEVRAHLEDAAHDLQMAGMTPPNSERKAIRRFGAPAEVAQSLSAVRSRERPRGARALVVVLAATVALMALGGSAVTSAYTVPPSSARRHPTQATMRPLSPARGVTPGGYRR